MNTLLNHQADVVCNGNQFQLNNDTLPVFIKSLTFEDEFEATMVFGLWLNFTKDKTNPSYHDFMFLIKEVNLLIKCKK